MEATFEGGADQFLQRSQYEGRRVYLRELCTSTDLSLSGTNDGPCRRLGRNGPRSD